METNNRNHKRSTSPDGSADFATVRGGSRKMEDCRYSTRRLLSPQLHILCVGHDSTRPFKGSSLSIIYLVPLFQFPVFHFLRDTVVLWTSQGVFFVLATKTIPVVAIRMPGFLHGERRVYPGGAKQNTHDVEAPKASTTLGGENHPSHQNVVNSSPRNSEGPSENETRVLEDMGGGIRSAGDTCAEARGAAGRGTIREEKASRGSHGGKGSVKTPELELPPRHWRCIVCKKVRRVGYCTTTALGSVNYSSTH